VRGNAEHSGDQQAGEALDALHREIERDRCRAILTSPHAELRERLARHLAYDTDLATDECVGLLRTAPIDPLADDEEEDEAL